MSKRKLVIIGNGMAGGRLVEDLLQRKLHELFDITVFGEERHGCYNRILIADLLGGASPDQITLRKPEWYAAQGVAFEPGVVVDRLDTAAKRVLLADGRAVDYDVAVLATGSRAFVPPLPGVTTADGRLTPGVFVFRTIEDCVTARLAAKPGARAAVVGGGLLGLEAARALKELGTAVTLVERNDHLLNVQLDDAGGRLVNAAFEKMDIALLKNARTKRVLGGDKLTGLEFEDGRVLELDLLVFSVGVRPRTDVAKASGIPVNRGVLVDDGLATQVGGVYAIGECAEHRGVCYGIVAPAWDMAKVLAERLAGNDKAAFTGAKLYTRLKVPGVEVLSMGDKEAAPGDRCLRVVEDDRGAYRKLVVRNGKLAGAVLVGDTEVGATLLQMFDRGTPVPENPLDLMVSFFGPEGGAGLTTKGDLEVCNCHHVTERTLVEAITGGCTSMETLTATTHAGTGCGSCRGQLAALIRKHAPVPTPA